MEPNESLITVGRIVESRGIHGQVVVYPLSDDPARFHDFDRVIAIDKTGETSTLEIKSVDVRTRHGRLEVLVEFDGVDSRESSDSLRGATLCMNRDELVLDDDEYFLFDLVGVSVETVDGQPIGSVKEVRRMPAQDIFVIARDSDQEVLIPDVPEFIDKSQLGEGKLLVRPIDGLLEG